MKILCLSNGIEVLNACNEKHTETIFSIDANDNIEQYFTFPGYLHIDKKLLLNKINACATKQINNGYLFYSFRYQISYCHFLTNTLPKLSEYLTKYNNYKLLVPKHHYNSLHKNIFNLIGITEENIELLENNTIYDIIDFKYSTKYEAPPSMYSNDHVNIYNIIRQSLNISQNNNKTRKIYIQRDSIANNEFNNSETGIKRQILNEHLLIDELVNNGFEIVTLGTKTIEEKSLLIRDAKILITPLGANIMNLIFTNAPDNIIFLSNENMFGDEYIISLIYALNIGANTKYVTLRYENDKTQFDIHNVWNSSFSVNINNIIKIVSQIV